MAPAKAALNLLWVRVGQLRRFSSLPAAAAAPGPTFVLLPNVEVNAFPPPLAFLRDQRVLIVRSREVSFGKIRITRSHRIAFALRATIIFAVPKRRGYVFPVTISSPSLSNPTSLQVAGFGVRLPIFANCLACRPPRRVGTHQHTPRDPQGRSARSCLISLTRALPR